MFPLTGFPVNGNNARLIRDRFPVDGKNAPRLPIPDCRACKNSSFSIIVPIDRISGQWEQCPPDPRQLSGRWEKCPTTPDPRLPGVQKIWFSIIVSIDRLSECPGSTMIFPIPEICFLVFFPGWLFVVVLCSVWSAPLQWARTDVIRTIVALLEAELKANLNEFNPNLRET